jgi:hypothetical protein
VAHDLPSSDVNFFAIVILVYRRVPTNNAAMHIPTMPTQRFAATPDLCGFARSTTYPGGAGNTGWSRFIVDGSVGVTSVATPLSVKEPHL